MHFSEMRLEVDVTVHIVNGLQIQRFTGFLYFLYFYWTGHE